jgi:sigma-B regulation protein RsbU (phosphoserine phosphatase)
MFVTAVYGELDMEQGKFTYVNAGHNPPLWVKVSGEIEKLTRTAIALGVKEQPNIQERTISLSFGDKLFLYTDGLTEAFSADGDLFGDVRLMEALTHTESQTSDEVIIIVEEHLNEFIGLVPLGDDLTMLAIRRVEDLHHED